MNDNYFFNFEKMTYVKGDRPKGCILCLIRDGSEKIIDLTIHRDGYFIVSVNLYPYNPGHILIFPVRHIEDIRELTGDEEKNLCSLKRHVLDLLDDAYSPWGYNIGYNMGPAAGASIKHLHLHIIPRYPRETGIADLIAKKRVLVEDPIQTMEKLRKIIGHAGFSNAST